jgi:hypothetical protein
MIKKLVIGLFIVAALGNSVGAAASYLGGDTGCFAKCCRKARQKQAGLSRLCCVVECNQPAGTNTPAPSYAPNNRQDTGQMTAQASGFKPPVSRGLAPTVTDSTRRSRQGPPLYLTTGTLLI